ncbi:MAG: Ger(x)C family spore germination protein [Syntrophomonadaceae bacterium]|jgi:spore germination protein KC
MQRLMIWCLCGSLMLSGLSGCYNRLEKENTVAVTGFGVDVEDGQKVFSVQVASPSGKPEQGGKAKTETLVLKNAAPGYAQAARLLLLSFPRTPIWSLSSTMLIGERVAREDVALMMDFVTRNRFVRPNIFMFLSLRNAPDEVMKVKTPPEDYSMVGLVRMIEDQGQQYGIYVPVTLRDFRTKYVTPGVEPVLPQVEILEVEGEKMLRLNGMAVFQGRHMVGSLNETESRGLRFLERKEIRGGLLAVNISAPAEAETGPLEDVVTMEIIRSRARCTPQVSPAGIRVLIEIESEGNIYEQNGTANLQTTANLSKLEFLTAQVIKDDVSACISRAQALQSDIFGWGALINQHHPADWPSLEQNWPEHFSSLEVQIEVKYTIRRAYLMEEPVPIQ